MVKPAEKLAKSLEALHELQKQGKIAIRAKDIERQHRELLVKYGFLQSVIKGWYIPTRPDETTGESTFWFASYWEFCAEYLQHRFGNKWCLSPEQSILLHVENYTVPGQLLIRSPRGQNNVTTFPFNTSLIDLKNELPDDKSIVTKNGLNTYALIPALLTCSPKFFQQHTVDARTALAIIQDASQLLPYLLDGGNTTIAGRLAGALRNIGKPKIADDILKAMKRADYDIREQDPFEQKATLILRDNDINPSVNRMRLLWQEMRESIISNFTTIGNKELDNKNYMDNIDDKYIADAYHSLSIEGYRVSSELLERVKSGKWDPQHNNIDHDLKNTLTARGYWQSFQLVKKSIEKVLSGEQAAQVAKIDHNDWHGELFAPSVAAGILGPADLAGYRNNSVFIRHSHYVPPNSEAVRSLMPALFELIANEEHAGVRIVLSHFFFVYIHPYMDGNGRIGRFLMNVMCADGGYSWTIIPVERRSEYMAALEEASVNHNIIPFCLFIDSLVQTAKI